MDLSISIVSYNAKEFLDKLLKSLPQQGAGISFEVLVTDNASTDGSPELVKRNYPSVHLTVNPQNVYFIKATNQNLRRSTGRYIMMMGEDTQIPPGALDKLVAYMDSHPEIGIVSPQLRNFDGTLQVSCCRFPTIPYAVFQYLFLHTITPSNPILRRHNYANWDRSTTREVDVVNGNGLTIRRQTMEKVGFLDESTRMYNEEVDWCYRAHRAGWKVVYNAEVHLLHYHGGSTQNVQPWAIYQMLHESLLHYYRKVYGWHVYIALKGLYECSSGLLYLKHALLPK